MRLGILDFDALTGFTFIQEGGWLCPHHLLVGVGNRRAVGDEGTQPKPLGGGFRDPDTTSRRKRNMKTEDFSPDKNEILLGGENRGVCGKERQTEKRKDRHRRDTDR